MKFDVSYNPHERYLAIKQAGASWTLGKIYFHKNDFYIKEILNMEEIHNRWNGFACTPENIRSIVAEMVRLDNGILTPDEVELNAVSHGTKELLSIPTKVDVQVPVKSGDDLIFDIWMNK